MMYYTVFFTTSKMDAGDFCACLMDFQPAMEYCRLLQKLKSYYYLMAHNKLLLSESTYAEVIIKNFKEVNDTKELLPLSIMEQQLQ